MEKESKMRRYLGNSSVPSLAHKASLTRRPIPFARAALRTLAFASFSTMALRHDSRSLFAGSPFTPVATRDYWPSRSSPWPAAPVPSYENQTPHPGKETR